jgi:hypothetical protein
MPTNVPNGPPDNQPPPEPNTSTPPFVDPDDPTVLVAFLSEGAVGKEIEVFAEPEDAQTLAAARKRSGGKNAIARHLRDLDVWDLMQLCNQQVEAVIRG